ncbi:MAG: peptidylprolyl isomerase [Cetobacterium sp.]
MVLNAKIVTSKGEINLRLFPEVAPVTVLNFAHLAKRGYYDGLKFHRVISDFMIQGGDPTGTGSGGPGYQFIDEFEEGVVFDKKGKLAMANAGPETNGSQFFITHVETPWLNYKHTIFGEVVSEDDQKVVDSISQGDLITTIEITGDVDEFLKNEENAEFTSNMDEILDSQFPNLRQY